MPTSESPYTPPTQFTSQPSHGVTESTIVWSWLIFMVVSLIGSSVAGGLAGGICGGVLRVLGCPLPLLRSICGIAGFTAGLSVSYVTFRWLVKRLLRSISQG